MSTTNPETGTRIDEIAASIYRISTPIPPAAMPGGFTFNQFLVLDDEPLLFHTGPRRMFPLVRQAIEHVMPIAMLRWVGFSHLESDECGALADLLSVAPRAQPVCGRIAATVSVADMVDRPVRALAEAEALSLGSHRVAWIDAPHMPHGWECGYLFEATTRTLLCGDLFTQGGAEHEPLVEADILEPSEAFRKAMDYYSHGAHAPAHLERMAALAPTTLACMHGSAWRGDGGRLLGALANRLSGERA
ncbi:MAG: MBL fold metallo-hydrolase [Deltaproteobacteria bacterium]|nr:MBL fold metallo-hydrolase [Deltaproteobacteria bacterium]